MKRIVGLALILAATSDAWGSAEKWGPPIKYATETTVYFTLVDSNSPWRVYATAPAAADVHVFQDGASEARATNAVTDLGRSFSLVLTVAESTAKIVTVDVNDASDPPLFGDTILYFPTFGHASAFYAFDMSSATVALTNSSITTSTFASGAINAAAIAADAIGASELAADAATEISHNLLDHDLSGNNHNTNRTTGWYVRRIGASDVIYSGTATAGTTNTITLPVGAATGVNAYFGNMIVLTGGTGAPQTRIISNYTGSTTRIVTVSKNWSTTPNATTTVEIRAASGSVFAHEGTAQAGGASSVTLATTASSTDHLYNGFFIRILSGTGADQANVIDHYDGATRVADVNTAWAVQPNNTSVYQIMPNAELTVDNESYPSVGEIVAGVIDATMDSNDVEVAVMNVMHDELGYTDTRAAYLDYLLDLGTPFSVDGSASTVFGVLGKIFDDNGGADYDPATNSLTAIATGDVELTVDADALFNATVPGTNKAFKWFIKYTYEDLP